MGAEHLHGLRFESCDTLLSCATAEIIDFKHAMLSITRKFYLIIC